MMQLKTIIAVYFTITFFNGQSECRRRPFPVPAMKCDVAIVGGGLSGLYMAYEILKEKEGTQVCVLEQAASVGGRIRDHRFEEAPNIDVGLGAWRVDKKQFAMLDFLDELGLKYKEWSFVEPSLYESRELTADNPKDIKIAYPMLKANSKFGNMSSGQLWDYILKPQNVAQSNKYSTLFTYMSNLLTSEGAYYLADLSGYKGDITEFISPTHYIEFLKLSYTLSDKYFRPNGGMSAIIGKLFEEVQHRGGQIYLNERVRSISKRSSKYILRTAKHVVLARKLVVAMPPKPFQDITGDIAFKIRSAPQMQSIQPIPAFKGAGLYKTPWWENVKIGKTTVKAGQKFISQDNCIGITMAHRGYGTNGEGVMHIMYNDGACAKRWKDIADLKKDYIDEEVHRALEAKFGVKIPKPIKTEYQFWDSAWHFQKPDTPYTMADISEWAKRPFKGEDIYIVGESYDPMRGWCQGAIVSCRKALFEGWGIERSAKHHSNTKRSFNLPRSLVSPARP